MNGRERDRLQRRLEQEIKGRFPEGAIQRVSLLQHGDAPVVEPGELLVRVFLTPPPEDGIRRRATTQAFRDPTQGFEDAHRKAMKKLRTDLARELPEVAQLELACDVGDEHHSRVQLLARGAPGERERAGDEATPVMARLGAEDLDTLDTLVAAGIATSRADAVRWALARIRERPAFRELRQRAQEIERLKTQF